VSKKHDCVAILDFGAINAQMAAKAVRQLNIYCEVLPCSANVERIEALKPKALIFQRGAACGERTFEREVPVETAKLGLPVLDLQAAACDAPTLKDFLVDQCGFTQDWTTETFIAETVADLQAQIGDRKVLLAMSGGVDSSVCAALLHRAVGKQLTCVFVDHGCMRKDEPEQIAEVFRDQYGINLITIDAEDRFLSKLEGRDASGSQAEDHRRGIHPRV